MTSHGCYLCLLLLSVILIEPSEAGCLDHFKEDGLTEAITKLPKNIPVKIMNKSEDIVVCSLKKRKDCINDEETCLLWNCFENKDGEDCNATYNKKDENISVPNFHFMCLTNITKHLHDKKNPPEVCKVYKKVCGEDSATPAPPKTSPTTPTIEATPSMTMPTIEATASTAPTIEATPSTAPTIEATPSTAPTVQATPSTPLTIEATSSTPLPTALTIEATPSTPLPTTPTIEATPSTAPAIEATPTIEATTKNPSTASTTKTTSSTSTTAASSLVNSQQKSCSEKEISSEKETGSDIQTISIGVLITTNIIVPIAVYLYMRYQIQQIRNLREEEGMTEIQQNPFPTDVEEGSNLLMTPESSIIINSPENTII